MYMAKITGQQIKKILKKHFPFNKFKVKTEYNKVEIKTNLLSKITDREKDIAYKFYFQRQPLTTEEEERLLEIYEKKHKENEEKTKRVKQILENHGITEEVDYDAITGETLGGKFIWVEPLE